MIAIELARAVAFVLCVCAVYLFAAWGIVRWFLERRLACAPLGKKGRVARRVAFVFAVLGTLCILYGRFIEPYWLEVTHVVIESEKLPPGSGPVRLVHISDLHCDPAPRLEERLAVVAAELKPDAILYTGDSVNSPAGLPVFRQCVKSLARVAPSFGVRGNWDTRTWRNLDLFSGTGFRELVGESVVLDLRGVKLWIGGAAVDDTDGEARALLGIPPDRFSIFLHHFPDKVVESAWAGVDLHLAGHTHGGQIALPFYGALMTLSKFGKRFESGLGRYESTWIHVNRGVGMEGGAVPRVRFCARPELTLIELRPARK